MPQTYRLPSQRFGTRNQQASDLRAMHLAGNGIPDRLQAHFHDAGYTEAAGLGFEVTFKFNIRENRIELFFDRGAIYVERSC